MAANVYECMFLLDTNKIAGDLANAEAQLVGLVQKHNAEALAHRSWDERRLAYPINKHKKGLYYLMYIRAEGKNLVDIERDITLNEMIIRSMILKIDPKLVDTMLSLAKGEHAPALHAIQDDPTDDTRMDDDMGDRPRRPRRQDGDKD
jgi:small subunit ribosomal protein S6